MRLEKPLKSLTRTYFYKPTIFTRIRYKIPINKRKPKITKIRNFLILNKFLKGDIMTKIKPAKLLIKKRG